MIRWAAKWVWWFLIRCIATFACMICIKRAAQWNGYHMEYDTLLIAAISAVIVIRLWAPSCKDEDEEEVE